jgi:hypothetical protein
VPDITERKYAEELLLAKPTCWISCTKRSLPGRSAAASSRIGVETLYGYTAGEAIGQSSPELLRTRSSIPMQEVEARSFAKGMVRRTHPIPRATGAQIIVESRHVRASYDGETYTLETSATLRRASKQSNKATGDREYARQLALSKVRRQRDTAGAFGPNPDPAKATSALIADRFLNPTGSRPS